MPRSKWESSAKWNILNVNDSFTEISLAEFYTDSCRSNSCESQNITSGVLLDIFLDITELGDGNWLIRAMSRGLTGYTWFYNIIRLAIV